jgi:1,4-alpha-glucan branching enzyme
MSNPSDHAPVAFFTRDPDTGMVVWSGEWGYPGDGAYLDFHKKHFPGGLRYWRVTQAKLDLGLKEMYDPGKVGARLEENAEHFVNLVQRLLAEGTGDRILTAPFDAELFGHWWFEGVRWLELVLRKMSSDPDVKSYRLGDWLEKHPPSEVVSLPEGSWGQGGFHWIWLNDSNAWTWERIYPAEERMEKLAGVLAGFEERGDPRTADLRETLKLAARELLLLEASDWQFLISTISAADYSALRVVRHADAFDRVAGVAERIAGGGEVSAEDRQMMAELSDRDFLFPDVDPAWWAKVEYP